MRIVSRKELMSLPAETVYSLYQPYIFSGLYATGGACGPDFVMCSLLNEFATELLGSEDIACEVMSKFERGEDVPMVFGADDVWGREGMFDDKQQYAVWSKHDLLGLAAFLTKAAGVAK